MGYEQKIQDIINAEIEKEVQHRIKNYTIYVKANGMDVDILCVDTSGGEITVTLDNTEM